MRNNLFSISPETPFLPKLVSAVLDGSILGDWPRTGPFWLSDVTIFLPTRRARLALSEAFADAMGGGALLPDIRTLGGETEEEELFLEPVETPAFLKAISPMSRRFLLASLVQKWAEANQNYHLGGLTSGQTNPAHILNMANSLARLIDDFEIENVSPKSIRTIVPAELAEQWQETLVFLEIALSAWPEILSQRSEIDTTALRNMRLQRQAQSLDMLFADRPVIAAGSTGSLPATANLMKAISKLPRGALVLPGLNTSLTRDSFANLLDQKAAPHGHPQYGLAHLLSKLGRTPQDVVELADGEPSVRTQLVRHALALASETAIWSKNKSSFSDNAIETATTGISIIAAQSEQEQARAIALAARGALERKQSVGIIAPDRNLARRIVAELKRFDINVDDSAGVPLFQSRAGRLVRQILSLTVNKFAPVDLMALLRNRHVTLGQSRSSVGRNADMVEFGLLRGQRPGPGIAGLRLILEQNTSRELPHVARRLTKDEGERIGGFLGQLEAALSPLTTLLTSAQFTSVQLADALMLSLEKLSHPEENASPPLLPGAIELANWARALSETPVPGPFLNARTVGAALEVLLSGISVSSPNVGHPDISIWGRLEARLQSADLMILSALNEGTWPEVADPGPWLSRGMRLGVGLEPPERQHGLAAHDFEVAIGNDQVVLAYAERIGTSPATQSRLLQRLLGFLGKTQADKLFQRGEHRLEMARRLDKSGPPKPAKRPAPKPAARLRPKSLSITEVETLFRSPFDLYAKYSLGLRQIDPLGEELGARERGSFIHDIFEKFVTNGYDPEDTNAEKLLGELAEQAFSVLDDMPDRRDIWLRRFKTAADGFLTYERNRSSKIATRFAETKLVWSFPVEGTDIILRGRADRIDLLVDGSFEIIDFKTGGIPSATEMRSFQAPQLLLEAMIVDAVGFEGVNPAPASALTYIKIGAGPKAFVLTPFALTKGTELHEAVDEIQRRFASHVSAFLLRDGLAMPPRLMPKANQTFRGPYDHLARTEEWTEIDSSEAGP